MSLDRRAFVAGLGAAAVATLSSPAVLEWQSIAPSDAGFAPDVDARLDGLVAAKRAWNLHGVLITRRRQVVLERYFEAEDFAYSRPLGRVAHGPNTLHDLRSVTKSIVGLLYGIALDRGLVPEPEQSLYAAFPEHADLTDDQRGRITIAHALTMTLGLEWNELGIPYTDARNDEIAMEMARDRYRHVLARKVVGEPGKRWLYSGGATALIGRVVVKGTGRPLHEFAREVLFAPLGIGRSEWMVGGRDRSEAAASGLRMSLRDLARIGHLLLDEGEKEGQQIVSRTWLREMLTPRVSADEMRRYGYQWYLGDLAFGVPPRTRLEASFSAMGNGGQRLFVVPGLDLVLAITAGNYSAPDQWVPPTQVLREVVLGAYTGG